MVYFLFFVFVDNNSCHLGITTAGLLASYYNIPVSSNSVVDSLKDKTKYQTLYRVAFTSTPLGNAMVSLVLKYNWTHVAIVRSHAAECNTGLSGFYTSVGEKGIRVQTELYADTPEDVTKVLGMVKGLARSKLKNSLTSR